MCVTQHQGVTFGVQKDSRKSKIKGYTTIRTITRNVDYTLPGNVGKVVTAYKGIPLIGVEPGRFYTQVTLLNTAAGGFGKTATTGRDLNFILVHVPSAKGGIIKYAPSDIIPAGDNANSWADTMKFRMYHGLVIMDNKKKGIYVHHKTT